MLGGCTELLPPFRAADMRELTNDLFASCEDEKRGPCKAAAEPPAAPPSEKRAELARRA